MAKNSKAVTLERKKLDTVQLWALAFCLPNILFFVIFFVTPAIVGIWYSLTNYNGLKRMDFIGVQNYVKLFKDRDFYTTLLRTVWYTIVNVPISYVVALSFGLLLSSERIKGISFLRILIYWPTLLSSIMVGLTWRWMFGENFGLINYILTGFGMEPIGWASNPTAAFVTTIIAGVWAGCGGNILIFIGALKQVPTELKEAARLDGASSWQVFKHVTLPVLKPVSFMVLMLSTISSFKVFALVQTLTGGGPGKATTYMIQYIYRTGFERNKVGYSSAASMVLFVILLVLSIIQTKVTEKNRE